MKKTLYIYLPLITILLNACGNNSIEVDVSDIDVEVKIKRFDKDIRAIENFNVLSFEKLKNEYGYFLDVFGAIVLKQQTNNPNYINVLQAFVEDPTIKEVDEKVNEVFTAEVIDEIKLELKEGFKHYRYYYPDSVVPEIITYNSAFNYAVSTLNKALAVSLDLYLGQAGTNYYDSNQFPKYKSQNMDKKYIARDCFKAIFKYNLYPNDKNKSDLLTKMIYNGKMLYFLDVMFPHKPDAWKISYNKNQIDWCKKNEVFIWSYFIEKDLLFSTNINDNNKYILDAPFTSGMSQNSPGSVGNWLGWQIVKKYMAKNYNMTLHELMKEQNAQKILSKSGYKPS